MLRKLLFVAGTVVVVVNREKIVQTTRRAIAYVALLRKSPMTRELLLRDLRAPFQRTFTSEEVLAELQRRHADSATES